MTFWQRIKIWILDTFTEPVEGSGSISRSTHKETGKAEIILNNNNSLAGTDKTDWRYWSRFTAIILAITILWQGATVYAFNEWASRYVNVKPVEVVHKPNEQWQERTISYNLSKVKHAGVSFNGEYLVWSENNNFTVWDLANDQPLYYEKMVKGESVAHVQWLEDRNRLLLIVERSVSPISLPAPPRTNNQTQTPAVEQSERNTQSVEASEVSTPQTASRGRAEEFASRGRLDSLVQSMNKIEAGSVSTQNFIKKFDIYFLNADGRQRIFSTHISGLSKEAIVQQAAVVTQSNLLYVVVGDQGFANNLYRVDVQHDALKVPKNARSRVETLMVGGIKGAFAEIWDTANDKQPQLYGLKGLQLARLPSISRPALFCY